MAEYLDREHFIPLRKNDLIELLVHDKQLPPTQREPFRQFCRLVSATIHFEYQAKLEELKDAYAPFDPDADTKPPRPLLPDERQGREDQVFAAFAALMERADFKHLLPEEIQRAVRQTPSDWGLHMDLDLGTSSSAWKSTAAATWSASASGGSGGPVAIGEDQGADVPAAGAGPEAARPTIALTLTST